MSGGAVQEESLTTEQAKARDPVKASAVGSSAEAIPRLQRSVGNSALASLVRTQPVRVVAAPSAGGLPHRRLQRQQGASQAAPKSGSQLLNLLRARNGQLSWSNYKGKETSIGPIPRRDGLRF
jgi:hypothetical protein